MKAPLEVIADYGIPTNSWLDATQYVTTADEDISYQRPGIGTLPKEEYEKRIAEVLGLDAVPEYESQKIARIYFGYTVQETIRNFQVGVPDMEWLWNDINQRAEKFMIEHPWAIKEYVNEDEDGEPKLDAAGNPKQRKGAKKELAKKVWADNADKQATMPRKEWIALLCEEVGLTPAGASTYYANLKKGVL
jgi:hypothetical protein